MIADTNVTGLGVGLFVQDGSAALQHTTFLRNTVRNSDGFSQGAIAYVTAVNSTAALRLGENVTFLASFADSDVGVNDTARNGGAAPPGEEEQVYATPTISVSFGNTSFESAALVDAPQGAFLSLEDTDFIALKEVRGPPPHY
jgi:hypothetical protein